MIVRMEMAEDGKFCCGICFEYTLFSTLTLDFFKNAQTFIVCRMYKILLSGYLNVSSVRLNFYVRISFRGADFCFDHDSFHTHMNFYFFLMFLPNFHFPIVSKKSTHDGFLRILHDPSWIFPWQSINRLKSSLIIPFDGTRSITNGAYLQSLTSSSTLKFSKRQNNYFHLFAQFPFCKLCANCPRNYRSIEFPLLTNCKE